MAHQSTIVENGMTYNVTEFDHTAQEIDDAVDALGGSNTPQGALVALGAGARPNLLVNPFFKVNQRGQSSYTGIGPTVDAWTSNSSTLTCTVTDNGVSIRGTGFDYLKQYIENPEQYNGMTLTASALVYNPNQRFRINLYNETKTESHVEDTGGSNGYHIVSLTVENFQASAGDRVSVLLYPAGARDGFTATAHVRAVKLEIGDSQTLGYQKDTGGWQLLEQPDPLEFLKCCQYQFVPGNAMRIRASRVTNSEIDFFVPLPVGLRTSPTIVNSQNLQIYNVTGGPAQTEFVFSCPVGSSASKNGVTVIATKTGHGLTDAFLYVNTPGGDDPVIFDANLP